MERGLRHLYWGQGKGKTTAAMGLALRSIGAGRRVVIVQFLKGADSGEIPLLRQLGAQVFRGKAGQKFVSQMTAEERAQTRQMQTEHLRQALALEADVLILDEACAAWQKDMVDRELLQRAVLDKPAAQELVLTGRQPAPWMVEAADYNTEMRCHRHPYEKQIPARKGVEF
jgi:cob(I)alamin adenosyltransferase